MYYNYQKLIKDLYEMLSRCEDSHKQTIRILIEECVMHYLVDNNVPFERQGEFLITMFPDLKIVSEEFRMKKFVTH